MKWKTAGNWNEMHFFFCLALFLSLPGSISFIFHCLPGSISFPFHCLPRSISFLFYCLPGSISFVAQVYFISCSSLLLYYFIACLALFLSYFTNIIAVLLHLWCIFHYFARPISLLFHSSPSSNVHCFSSQYHCYFITPQAHFSLLCQLD